MRYGYAWFRRLLPVGLFMLLAAPWTTAQASDHPDGPRAMSPQALRDAMREYRMEQLSNGGSTVEPGATQRSGDEPLPEDDNWGDEFGQGLDGPVYAMVEYLGELYVSGDFTSAANYEATYIARWNGTRWTDVGGGMDAVVTCLAVYQGQLVAGGLFHQAGGSAAARIAAWDGTSWSALGSGMDNEVYALGSFAGDLYATGAFMRAGGTLATRIASWDGTSWSPLGSGLNGIGLSLAVRGTFIMVAGWFTNAGGIPTPGYVAGYDGANWTALGSGPGLSICHDLVEFEGDLIVCGRLGVSRWDGVTWTTLGSLNDEAHALEVFNDQLIVGGYFTVADGQRADRIARWTGTAWEALDLGANALVRALAVYGNDLYVGGHFDAMQGDPGWNYVLTDHVARWDGSSWNPVGSGINFEVTAIIEYGGGLVASGFFYMAGGTQASRIASWDGVQWSPLGQGLNGSAFDLAIYQGDLIAGGNFSEAGGQPASRVARWDGTSWHPMGDGLTGNYVDGLLELDGLLYASGYIQSSGATQTLNIAVWDGVSWGPVGSGISNGTATMEAFEGDLIVGGNFTMAGGVPASYVARWDGVSWSAMGSGTDDFVLSSHVHNGVLYIGGYFTEAGGAPASYIARWNGSDWEDLGSTIAGINWPYTHVNYMGSYAGDLIVVGHFSQAAGISASNVARWDGSVFSALGSGLTYSGEPRFGWAWEVLTVGDDLYICSNFDRAGHKSSYGIHRWRDGAPLDSPAEAPEASLRLGPAHPNPFRAVARMAYEMPEGGRLRATVHDAQGRLVRTLADGRVGSGNHELTWDGRDMRGRSLPVGAYFVRVEAGAQISSTKLILIR